MARHRTHSITFKRQVAQEVLARETVHGLARRHDVSHNLIRVWVQRYEAGAFGEDATATRSPRGGIETQRRTEADQVVAEVASLRGLGRR